MNYLAQYVDKALNLTIYRIRIDEKRDLDGAIVATGFPFKQKQHAAVYMNIMTAMFDKCADFKSYGFCGVRPVLLLVVLMHSLKSA